VIEKTKNKRGFTLGEMVTTVAIIGTLSAIAVPNYLRIKMEVNMMMVKQELRTIQRHMNDAFNQSQKFPQNLTDLGASAEEQFIMDSLVVLDRKNYLTNDYRVNPSQSNYQFQTCPKQGHIGSSGNQCFTMNSIEITSAALQLGSNDPWDGSNVNTLPWTLTQLKVEQSGPFYEWGYYLLNLGAKLTQSQQVQLTGAALERVAYQLNYLMNETTQEDSSNDLSLDKKKLPSTMHVVTKEQEKTIKEILSRVYENLLEKGVRLYMTEQNIEEASARFSEIHDQETINNILYISDKIEKDKVDEVRVLEFSYELEKPFQGPHDYEVRIQESANQIEEFEKLIAKKENRPVEKSVDKAAGNPSTTQKIITTNPAPIDSKIELDPELLRKEVEEKNEHARERLEELLANRRAISQNKDDSLERPDCESYSSNQTGSSSQKNLELSQNCMSNAANKQTQSRSETTNTSDRFIETQVVTASLSKVEATKQPNPKEILKPKVNPQQIDVQRNSDEEDETDDGNRKCLSLNSKSDEVAGSCDELDSEIVRINNIESFNIKLEKSNREEKDKDGNNFDLGTYLFGLRSKLLTESQRIDALASYLETRSNYLTRKKQLSQESKNRNSTDLTKNNTMPSQAFYIPSEGIERLRALLPPVQNQLKANGLNLLFTWSKTSDSQTKKIFSKHEVDENLDREILNIRFSSDTPPKGEKQTKDSYEKEYERELNSLAAKLKKLAVAAEPDDKKKKKKNNPTTAKSEKRARVEKNGNDENEMRHFQMDSGEEKNRTGEIKENKRVPHFSTISEKIQGSVDRAAQNGKRSLKLSRNREINYEDEVENLKQSDKKIKTQDKNKNEKIEKKSAELQKKSRTTNDTDDDGLPK
jgi:prepilin-type N-terminal cleavage/methylation domain-containing protein